MGKETSLSADRLRSRIRVRRAHARTKSGNAPTHAFPGLGVTSIKDRARAPMSDPDALDRAFKRLDEALARLEAAVERRAAEDASYAGLAEEVARLSDDRAQLALDLDAQLARAARLEEANKDVSRRLVSAMETIRSVLDAHGG